MQSTSNALALNSYAVSVDSRSNSLSETLQKTSFCYTNLNRSSVCPCLCLCLFLLKDVSCSELIFLFLFLKSNSGFFSFLFFFIRSSKSMGLKFYFQPSNCGLCCRKSSYDLMYFMFHSVKRCQDLLSVWSLMQPMHLGYRMM